MTLGQVLAVAVEVSALAAAASLGPPGGHAQEAVRQAHQ